MAASAARWDASSTGSSPNTATKLSGLCSWMVAPKLRALSASAGSTPPVSATGGLDPARVAYRNARWRPSHRALRDDDGAVAGDPSSPCAVVGCEGSPLGAAPRRPGEGAVGGRSPY